jgi:hypothetical protein
MRLEILPSEDSVHGWVAVSWLAWARSTNSGLAERNGRYVLKLGITICYLFPLVK